MFGDENAVFDGKKSLFPLGYDKNEVAHDIQHPWKYKRTQKNNVRKFRFSNTLMQLGKPCTLSTTTEFLFSQNIVAID